MRILFTAFIISLILPSCYTYRIFPKAYRNFTHTGNKQKAFVLNPELTRENEIIQQSGIFIFTGDSVSSDVVKIRLYPIKRDFKDAPGAFVWFFIIGQLPMSVPDVYTFRFDEMQPAVTVHHRFDLNITMRYWFWDVFVFKKNFARKAGQTLLASYYDPAVVSAAAP